MTHCDDTATYTVNLWGSDPDLENDDCWTGDDFATLVEAERVYADPLAHFETGLSGYYSGGALWVELDGPNVNKARCVRADTHRGPDDSWQSEHAMQMGMAFGCEGYNDAMGY